MINSTLTYNSTYTDTSLNIESLLHPVVDNDVDTEKQKGQLILCYIGDDANSYKHLRKHFTGGINPRDLTEAFNCLKEIHLCNNTNPDVLIVDVPLNINEFSAFCRSVSEERLLFKTPIIFNEKRLNPLQILSLQELGLVDDVFDIGSAAINYNRKIIFLKRMIWEHEKLRHQKVLKNYNLKVKTQLNIKRIIDVTFCSLAVFFLLPVFILIAIAIKLESKGPIFYAAQRAGRGFKIFKFYKFRSMVVDADKKMSALAHLNQYNSTASGPLFVKISSDPRVTKVGKFLRNTSLDELPQLLNVIKGDMSLVGNRPLPIYEAITLTTNDYVDRFEGPAGITGLWQVKKRGKAEMTVEERVSLDIHYSKKYNILFDFKIMAMTPVALFQKSDV